MKKSKLIVYLRQLDDSKKARFTEFVNSPFFNKKSRVMQLLEYIFEEFKQNDGEEVAKEKAHQFIFGKEKEFNAPRINVMMSSLSKLYYKFLTYIKIEEEHVISNVLMVSKGLTMNFLKLEEDLQKRAKKKINKNGKKSAMTHLGNYYLDTFNYDSDWRNKRSINKKAHLSASAHLDQMFGIFKARNYINIASTYDFVEEPWGLEDHFTQDFFPYLLKKYPNNRVLELTIAAFWVWYQPSEKENYKTLKSVDVAELKNFSLEINWEIMNTATSYCIRQLIKNKGNNKQYYYQELFDWYQKFICAKLFDRRGVMRIETYTNIFRGAMYLQKYDWCALFLQKYRPFLPEESRESIFALNQATLYFAKGELDEAQLLLIQTKFNRGYEYTERQILLCKIYFEQEEWSLLECLLESLRVYLIREKGEAEISSNAKMSFVRILKKITLLRQQAYLNEDVNKEEEDILEEIKENPVAFSDWLIKQLEVVPSDSN